MRDRQRDEENRVRAGLEITENQRKTKEASDLEKERNLQEQKVAQTQAADFQRQQIIQSQVAKGTNYIDAIRNGLMAVPLPNVKDTSEVLATLDKVAKPPERYGAATMQAGDKTLFGQTNNEGRFFPISTGPQPPKPAVRLQTSDTAPYQYVTTPVTSSTNVLNTLPPDLQTNAFNKASMASIPSSPQPSGPQPPASAPIVPNAPPAAPDNFSPSFALSQAQSAPPQPDDSTTAPTPAAAPADSSAASPPKQFKDKTGTVWSYTGTAADPTSDRDPNNWQPAQ